METQSQHSSDNIGSERLRKAIERNRAKQAKREGKTGPSATSHSASASSVVEEDPAQTSFFDREWQAPGKSKTSRSRSNSPSSSARSQQRRGVARPDEETEFASEVKRNVKKAPAKASYAPAKKTTNKTVTRSRRTTRKTQKKTDKDFVRYLVIGSWMFCAFLLGRLIFSTGGVLDYYQSQQQLDARKNEFERIVQENKDLVKEIEMIKTSSSYQKELVRKHLGFIADDEFLILFPKDGKTPSI